MLSGGKRRYPLEEEICIGGTHMCTQKDLKWMINYYFFILYDVLEYGWWCDGCREYA
jgi:hypothetical protein